MVHLERAKGAGGTQLVERGTCGCDPKKFFLEDFVVEGLGC